MRVHILSLFLITFTIAFSSHADQLSDYVAQCKQKLEITWIPGDYSCFDGAAIPTSTKFALPTPNNYLGKVNIWENPSVDAVYLCRSVSGTGPTATAALNGYILQNRDNGYTCFFDAKANANATTRSNLHDSNASDHWRQPADMDGAPCSNCHAPDPFIVSPGLAQAFKDHNLLYNGRNLLGEYKLVGNDSTSIAGGVFYNQEASVQAGINSAVQCAQGCHINSDDTPTISNMNSYMPPLPGTLYDLDDEFIFNNTYRIQNYWNFNAYISLNSSGHVKANSSNWNTLEAEWTFEKVENYYRIKSASGPNEYLHMENGVVESGPIQTGWWSSHWILEPYSNNPPVSSGDEGLVYHIKNRWTGKYLNMESGSLYANNYPTSYWSTRWKISQP